MKPFVRLRHVGRGFLVTGIASLLVLTGVAAMSLSTSPVAHADGWTICPNNSYVIGENSDGTAKCADANTLQDKNCPSGQKPDPDSAGCIPNNQPCGSASTYDSANNTCNVYSVKGFLDNQYNFGQKNPSDSDGDSDDGHGGSIH